MTKVALLGKPPAEVPMTLMPVFFVRLSVPTEAHSEDCPGPEEMCSIGALAG